jgi:hypothetical protein
MPALRASRSTYSIEDRSGPDGIEDPFVGVTRCQHPGLWILLLDLARRLHPIRTGIFRSISTRSGRLAGSISSASAPSCATPTISSSGHNNYRGYDYYENMLYTQFLFCLLKRIFYDVHFVSISSRWNVLVLRKKRTISSIRTTPEIIQIVAVFSFIAPTSVAT